MVEKIYNGMVKILEDEAYSEVCEAIEESGYMTSTAISEMIYGSLKRFEKKVGEDDMFGDKIFKKHFKDRIYDNVMDRLGESEESVLAKGERETGKTDVLYGFDIDTVKETAEEERIYSSIIETDR